PEAAEELLLLELEAKDDVQSVRRLVGVHADQRRPWPVDRAMEPLARDGGKRVRALLPEARIEPPPERQRAPDHVLPQTALGLVQRRRASGRERRPVERRAASVLVEPVPALH